MGLFCVVQEMTGCILFGLPESVPVGYLLGVYEQCVCFTNMYPACVVRGCSIAGMHVNI